MIAAFLGQYLGLAKLAAIVALVVGLIAGYFAWHHQVFTQGIEQESTRRDKIDEAARAALANANEQIRQVQAALTVAIADLQTAQGELQSEQVKSAAYQSDLRSGAQRLRVLIAARPGACPGPPDGADPTTVDPGASITADLDPAVAGGLVALVSEGDSAITRLNACITAYDSVATAVNGVR